MPAMDCRHGKGRFSNPILSTVRGFVFDLVSLCLFLSHCQPIMMVYRSLSTCKDKEQMLFSTQVEFDPSGDEKIGKRVSLEAVYQVCGIQINPFVFIC